MKYIPKIRLVFRMKDGTEKEGMFPQGAVLWDVMTHLGVKGRTSLDPGKTLGELGLTNNQVIKVG